MNGERLDHPVVDSFAFDSTLLLSLLLLLLLLLLSFL